MLLRQIIEALTPTSCLGCGREGEWLCANCRSNITLPAQACFACGRLSADGRTCANCARRYALSGAVVAAHYEDEVKELILTLKFHRAEAAATSAAQIICTALPEALIMDLDGVTAVPVAPGRRRERGYNQSELMGRQIARELKLPFQATTRRNGSMHQMGAGRRERLAQVDGAFEPICEVEGHWLVVDDVLTTGATLEACAIALRAGGASKITAAVVAGQRG